MRNTGNNQIRKKKIKVKSPVYRIRIGLNTDPDLAFKVDTDPDPAFEV